MLQSVPADKIFSLEMRIISVIVAFLLITVEANLTNDFVIDYFTYKKPSSIVGYSCNNITDDIKLLKYLNENGFVTIISKLSNESEVYFPNNIKYYKVGIFLDTRCYSQNDIASVYLGATNQRAYGELHYWLVIGENLTGILEDINDDAFGLSTDLVVAVSKNSESFQIYDVYNPYKTRGYEMNVTFYGDWNSEKGLNVDLTQIKPLRRINLHGMPLKMIFFQAPYKPKNMSLIEYLHEYRDITKDASVKFCYVIVSHLSDILNFSFDYVEAGKWEHGDGLGPLIRAVANSTVDLTGSSGIMTHERAAAVKFLHKGWLYGTCFIFRNPQPKTIKIAEIMRPFTDGVWSSIGYIFIISIVILVLTFKLDYEHSLTRISHSFIIIIGAMCQQSTEIKMSRLSTRITFFFMLIFSLLIYNYYSACVVSARLDEPIIKINDSLAELGKLRMKLASERMFYLNFNYATADKVTKKFNEDYWFKIPESQQFMDPEVGIELVRKGLIAYNVHPDIAYVLIEKYYDQREICELMEVHWMGPAITMFATMKNSTMAEIMKIGFLKIIEVGLHHRQTKRWRYRKPVCRKNILTASSICIHEFAMHLILLIIGIFLALIVNSIEMMITKQRILIASDFNEEKEFQA